MNVNTTGKEIRITVRGLNQALAAGTEKTLLDYLTGAGIPLEANCGGRGACGKCRVRVLTGQVADLQGVPAEASAGGFFLACQVRPMGNLEVELSELSAAGKGEITSLIVPGAVTKIKKVLIEPVYPTVSHHYSLQQMVARELGGEIPLDFSFLKELADVARRGMEKATLLIFFGEPTAIEPGDSTDSLYGVAFDIGTTTVVGILADLNGGRVLAVESGTNPQASYGADVISRIRAAGALGGLDRLSSAIRKCMNDIISKLCSASGRSEKEIYMVIVAGNTTMEHLLAGISPDCLGRSPYIPAFTQLRPLPPQMLDININPGGRVVFLPSIAGFVGADTVAAVLAVDQDITDKYTLLIDLGTNGEIVLGNRERLLVCSTAAGPAFEGAHLHSGMRAAPGAIDDVTIDSDVIVKTVGGAGVRGICGSGAVKALAEMLKAGIIDKTGRFTGPDGADALSPELRRRIREKGGWKEFVLVYSGESATGEDISITQKDIREIQLVKSSIKTGIHLLMESRGVGPEGVEQVLIAGAFGNYLNIDSALAIGLLPDFGRDKIRSVGNAAGSGAALALLSAEHLERSYAIAERADFLELAGHKEFQSVFLGNLFFPGVGE